MTGIRLLASSAGACFGNLDWDYKRDDDVLRFLRGLIYFASAFVVLLLCTSSYTYINAAIPHPPHMIITLIFLAGTLIYLGYLPGIRHAVTTVARRVRRALPVTNRQHGGSVKASRAREDKIVDWCIWTALGYLATAAIAAGIRQSRCYGA
jgi:hypothetical protein